MQPNSPPGPPVSGEIQADFVGDDDESPLCQPTCEPTLGCKEEDHSTSNSTSNFRGCTSTCPSTPSCVTLTCSWDPAEKGCSCPHDTDDDRVTCSGEKKEHPYCHFDSADGACKADTAAVTKCKGIACTSLQPERASCILNGVLGACEAELLEGARTIMSNGMIGGNAAPEEETAMAEALNTAIAAQNPPVTPPAPPKEPPTFVRYPVKEVLERKLKRKYHYMGYPENILSVMRILKMGYDPPHEETSTTTTETSGHSGEGTTEDPVNLSTFPPPDDESTSVGPPEGEATTPDPNEEGHPTVGRPDEVGKKKKKRRSRKRTVGNSQMKARGIPIKVKEDGDQLTIVGK
jgi:hypothetical protein